MNLPDDYAPSVPVDDRRRARPYWRPQPASFAPNYLPFQPRELGEQRTPSGSLLDMLDASGIRGGLSRELGYNNVGRGPQMMMRPDNRLPLPALEGPNYPAQPYVDVPYNPATIGWEQPWTLGR